MNDTLLIKYNYDYLIESIQTGMEGVRCLTADVLIKQAVEVPIEIIATISCYTYSTLTAIKNKVNTDVSYWIDSLKTLGGEFDKSDIVSLIKQTIDVDSVDLDTLQIAVKGYDPQKKISCAGNEYFKTANIILNVAYNTSVSA
jgi:phage-related baseplate assembly protein